MSKRARSSIRIASSPLPAPRLSKRCAKRRRWRVYWGRMLSREKRSPGLIPMTKDSVRKSYMPGLSAILWSQGISWLESWGFVVYTYKKGLCRATNTRGHRAGQQRLNQRGVKFSSGCNRILWWSKMTLELALGIQAYSLLWEIFEILGSGLCPIQWWTHPPQSGLRFVSDPSSQDFVRKPCSAGNKCLSSTCAWCDSLSTLSS